MAKVRRVPMGELWNTSNSSHAPYRSRGALAVLVSAGLDSAILLAEALDHHPRVHPLYVRSGLHWETAELNHLCRFLGALERPALAPLQLLEVPVGDLYAPHWSLTGNKIPDADSLDDAVFLPGRNVLLLSKAILWCHLQRVPAVALGVLHSNPFPDATPAFFAALQKVVNEAVGGAVEVRTPYAGLTKAEVVKRRAGAPLELTFSCLDPADDTHCGRCNKCNERRRAFVEAHLADPTVYRSDKCTG
jgi:7-cyano-7-deazaguanine synthase